MMGSVEKPTVVQDVVMGLLLSAPFWVALALIVWHTVSGDA